MGKFKNKRNSYVFKLIENGFLLEDSSNRNLSNY